MEWEPASRRGRFADVRKRGNALSLIAGLVGNAPLIRKYSVGHMASYCQARLSTVFS